MIHFFNKLTLIMLISGFALYACNSNKPTSGTDDATATTTVYVVRHAEKDLSDTTDNPPLTAEGMARAENLKNLLDTVEVTAIFSTPYQRNTSTVAPLAQAHNLDIENYEAHNFEQISNNILQNHAGETVVVCGHSNTVLPIVQQFGATPPLDSIPDDDYSNLFRVSVPKAGDATVSVIKF